MKEINIGSNIADFRKQKNVTQEQLADFLCVSKPAVSKWESGQSYPDITLLPLLASYFNTTVDTLLGYEPQMTSDEIRKLYHNLAEEFVVKPFDEVYSKCLEYLKKYFSCWKLQFYIAVLFINHANLAPSKENIDALFKESSEIFNRVSKESNDIALARKALSMEGLCYIYMNKPSEAIKLLEDLLEIPISIEVLLSKAYQMKGDSIKAKALLQRYIYQNIMGIIGACPDFMLVYSDNPLKAEDCYNKIIEIANIFNINKMHPHLYFNIYLTAAYFYATQGNKNSAIIMLENYLKVLDNPDTFPLKLKGNDFFDLLDDFLSSHNLGSEPPRNEKLIRISIRDSVINNPVFKSLEGDERYEHIVKRLRNLV